MLCKNCNSNVDENFEYCPNCGARVKSLDTVESAPVPSDTNVFEQFGKIFSKPLFFAAVILATVSAVLNLAISGASGIVSIAVSVVGLVGLWMLYSASLAKDARKTVRSFDLIHISATIQYVLGWIETGLFALLGVLFGILSFVINDSFVDEFRELFFESIDELAYGVDDELYEIYDFIIANSTLIFVIAAVVCLIAAAVAAALTIFYYGNMRKCSVNLRDAVLVGAPINVKLLSNMRIWLLVIGILTGVSALGSLLGSFSSFAASGCQAAFLIIISVQVDGIRRELTTSC